MGLLNWSNGTLHETVLHSVLPIIHTQATAQMSTLDPEYTLNPHFLPPILCCLTSNYQVKDSSKIPVI